jgi:hypothetical protein
MHLFRLEYLQALSTVDLGPKRTRGTEASAAGRIVRACVARELKREGTCGVGGRKRPISRVGVGHFEFRETD